MVLYVRPDSHMFHEEIFPMSLPAIMNRVGAHVEGRFHNEWHPGDIRKARIIILEIHWYLSLKSAIALSFQFKAKNPDVTIVAGGVTASLFARQILKDSAIDYIITGDADQPLACFVEIVLGGGDVGRVPNLVGIDGPGPLRYCVTKQDLDQGDFGSLQFFSSMEKRLEKLHLHSNGHVYCTYPYLVAFRGCPYSCASCYGGSDNQKRIFGRSWVQRSAHRIREDLLEWSLDTRWRYVNVFHDFISVFPEEDVEQILNYEYDLDIFYDFFQVPSEYQLARLLGCFRGGRIMFHLDGLHSTTPRVTDIGNLLQRIAQINQTGCFEANVSFVQGYVRQSQPYRTGLQRIQSDGGASLYRADGWWRSNMLPDQSGQGKAEDYKHCFNFDTRFWLLAKIFKAGKEANRLFPQGVRFLEHLFSKGGFTT